MGAKTLSKDINLLPTVSSAMKMRGCLRYLSDNLNVIGHLSVQSECIRYFCAQNILDNLNSLREATAKYLEWYKNYFTVSDSNEATEALKGVFDAVNGQLYDNYSADDHQSDIFSLININTLTEVVTKLIDLDLVMNAAGGNVNTPDGLAILDALRMNIKQRLWMVFNTVIETLAAGHVAQATPEKEINNFDVSLICKWNDEVVALSSEEKELKVKEEENRKREAEAKRIADEKAAAVEARRNEVKTHAKIIADAYDQHNKQGNLPNIKFTKEFDSALRNMSTEADCDWVEHVYQFLIGMSNSVRYMPGEQGDPFERVMGSFMELNNDVVSYHAPFTLYVGAGSELSVKHISSGLKAFEINKGNLAAQFVNNKRYIDDNTMDPSAPTIVHLLWCD